MAIAAGVAAAAATAVSVGASIAQTAMGPDTPGKPEIQQVPKRPFETAQQKYMSRVMMANLNTRGPTYQDWLKSGGTAQFQLQQTGMTPLEAKKMGFVGPGGQEPAWYDPSESAALTPEQRRYAGIESGKKAKGPFARLGKVARRVEKLEALAGTEAGLRPGQQKRLERLRTRQEKLTAATAGAENE